LEAFLIRCALAGLIMLALARSLLASEGRGAACVTFVGDIGLSRQVAAALQRRAESPWAALPRAAGDAWIGNLEGALYETAEAAPPPTACHNPSGLCLPIGRAALQHLSGAFTAVSLANNHSDDYGTQAATAAALRELGVTALTEEDAPHYLQLAGQRWALVPLNLINRSADELEATLLRARLQLGLAAAHTPRVVALPHWGREYSHHAQLLEREVAAKLHAWGALLVIGSHSHVIQEQLCEGGQATYFGLGNHLFDGPPATWQGLQVRCCEDRAALTCSATRTQRTAASPFPRPVDEHADAACRLPLPRESGERTDWQRHPGQRKFVFVQPYRSLGAGAYFALHRKYASFDHETALRPLVFRIVDGRAVDLWRGTALSRPLLAARLLTVGDNEYLCALHRGDSFLKLEPTTRKRLHVVYKWSGFGFRGVTDAEAQARCQRF
jgi:poly-gamma-glutamate synthesis protein (capsule biosynthesis protein)